MSDLSDPVELRELLDRYFDRGLSPEQKARLESLLRADEKARAEFWDRAQLHSALRTSAQRRRGERLAQQIKTQATEPTTPEANPTPFAVLPAPPKRRLASKRTILALAAAITVAALGTWISYLYTPLARLTNATNVQWNGSSLSRGDVVRRGTLHLTQGVAQIEFFNGAKVVLQGPADFRIVDEKTLLLRDGRLSAEVPTPAHGFTVQTREGDVVDLGTRFGVSVTSGGSTDVHVFEGAVNLKSPSGTMKLTEGAAIASTSGKLTPTSANPKLFPHPTSTIATLLKGGDFERDDDLESGGIPTRPLTWKGDPAKLVRATDGVTPMSGSQMMSFQIEDDQAVNEWQMVDLTAAKIAAPGATLDATFSANVNRAKDAATRGTFAVTIAAFRGSRDRATAMWAQRTREALALHQETLTADRDPATWQRLSARIVVPPTADFLMVHIAANWLREPPVDGTNYIHLSANNERSLNPRLRRKALTSDAEFNVWGGAVLGQLTHHVVTYDANSFLWRWYRDGALAATLQDNDGVSTLTDVNNWLGRSQYDNNSNFEGTFHEFRIYDYPLTLRQVEANRQQGPSTLETSPKPRFRWSFGGPSKKTILSNTPIPDSITGATAYVRGQGAAFNDAGDGVVLPGGRGRQAYIDLPNGVASGTYNGGTRFSSLTYEFWCNQRASHTWSRYFDFGVGTAGELPGPDLPPIAHFADGATLEITLPPQAGSIP